MSSPTGLYVVLQDRPVVGLQQRTVDVLVAAGRDRRTAHLVTPPTSRLTVPLWMALSEDANRWVVRDTEDG